MKNMGIRFSSRLMLGGLALTLMLVAGLACSSAPDDGGGSAQPAAQTQASPTPPPTVVPPNIPSAAPTAAPAAAQAGGAMMSGGDITRGGHLRVINATFPPKWDFSQTSTWISLFHFGGRMYSGLLQFSPRDGIDIWPDMADSWEVTNDSKTFTFKINENLTQWNDGEPFDVDHIIYAIDRWRNPPEGVIQPRVGAFALIDTMRKVDDRTLEINLTESFGDFIAESANQWHGIIPQHILEANESTIPRWQDVIGTGPYTIIDAEDGISVDSEKNANYFRDAPDGSPYPYLDRVTSIVIIEPQAQIAAMRTKQTDATKPTFSLSHVEYQNLLNDFPGEATFKVEPFVDVAAIQLNNQSPPFDNIDARRAVFYGFNKQGVIDAEGAENPVFPISWFSYVFPPVDEIVETIPGYKAEKRAEEIELAREFAQKGGLTEFEVVAVTARSHHGELLQLDMADIGVEVEIRLQDWTAMIASVEGRNYQAATGGTAPSYGGVVPVADIMYSPGGGRNGGWDPPQNYQDAWNSARTLPDTAERNDLFREMHRIMAEEWVPSVPYMAANQNKFHWNYVHNWDLVVQEIFSNNKFEDVWLDCDAPNPGQGC